MSPRPSSLQHARLRWLCQRLRPWEVKLQLGHLGRGCKLEKLCGDTWTVEQHMRHLIYIRASTRQRHRPRPFQAHRGWRTPPGQQQRRLRRQQRRQLRRRQQQEAQRAQQGPALRHATPTTSRPMRHMAQRALAEELVVFLQRATTEEALES